MNIYKRKASLKRFVCRHDLKTDSESTVLSWSGLLFHKVDAVLSKRQLPYIFVLVVGTWRSDDDRERRERNGTYGFTSSVKYTESASKQLNVLRKLKYRLNRNYLETMYLTFIRSVLEYASEVWDNCGQLNSDRLEKVQLEAARIVTGLPSFASIHSIYIETG